MKLQGYVKKGKLKRKELKKPKPRKESSLKPFHVHEIEVKGVKTSHVPPRKEWTQQNKQMGTPYGKFLIKYDNLEKTIDSFNVQDLVFYFREVANENGYKYMLNFSKECGQMKRLMQVFSNREICGMIEFLYTSNQDYLDKSRLSIGLLSSSWVNTIYADFNLWLEDKYVPASKRSTVRNEWKEKDKKSSVGEW